jgi:signal transduction histidine kinase
LSQILTILSGSAVSFTQAGQVTMEIALVDQTEMEAMLRFSISDTGNGLTPERMNSVFEALSPENVHRPRSCEEAGLGLSMAGRLADLMGGHIFAQSREGEGTAFHLTVALELQERPIKELVRMYVSEVHGI